MSINRIGICGKVTNLFSSLTSFLPNFILNQKVNEVVQEAICREAQAVSDNEVVQEAICREAQSVFDNEVVQEAICREAQSVFDNNDLYAVIRKFLPEEYEKSNLDKVAGKSESQIEECRRVEGNDKECCLYKRELELASLKELTIDLGLDRACFDIREKPEENKRIREILIYNLRCGEKTYSVDFEKENFKSLEKADLLYLRLEYIYQHFKDSVRLHSKELQNSFNSYQELINFLKTEEWQSSGAKTHLRYRTMTPNMHSSAPKSFLKKSFGGNAGYPYD